MTVVEILDHYRLSAKNAKLKLKLTITRQPRSWRKLTHMEYTERPKKGKGRKAWDRFVSDHNEQPMSVSYTPSYDYEFKGWICKWNINDPLIKHIGYGGSSCHTFYLSSEL